MIKKSKFIKTLVITSIVGLLFGAALFKMIRTYAYEEACAKNLTAWWSLSESRNLTEKVTPGEEELSLGTKLTALAVSNKSQLPPDRCPMTGRPYVFLTKNPGENELPCSCQDHKNVIRWKETP